MKSTLHIEFNSALEMALFIENIKPVISISFSKPIDLAVPSERPIIDPVQIPKGITTPATAKGGKISSIVPMVSHVDQTSTQ